MDYFNRCLYCLEPVADNAHECPCCGRRGVPRQKYADALPAATILAARYLIGQTVERSNYLIRYVAYDCAGEEKVYIDEFFPRGMAHRTAGMLNLEIDRDSAPFAERAKKAWMGSEAKAAFQENNTVYLVFADAPERTPDEECTVTQAAPVKMPRKKSRNAGNRLAGVSMICIGLAFMISGAALFAVDRDVVPPKETMITDAPVETEPVETEPVETDSGDEAEETPPVQTDTVTRKDKDHGGSLPDTSGGTAPSTPGGNGSDNPSAPEPETPGGDGSDTPGGDGNDNPGENGNDNPGENGNNTPGGDGNDNPGENSGDTPGGNSDAGNGSNTGNGGTDGEAPTVESGVET